MARLLKKSISAFIVFCLVLYPQGVYALPQGENVVGGAASFDYSTADELTVTQTSNRLATEWQSFSIGSPEKVIFDQPNVSSIALNKVVGVDPSCILGALKANGRVFLINPNGIVFGVNSTVDTAGLIASTLDLDMGINDFVNGTGDSFTFSGPGGSVVNYGTIKLNGPGGYAALLGSSVKNAGLIEAELGKVMLAAGEKITLDLDPAGLISVAVDIEKGTNRNDDAQYAAVNNRGTITANGGKVVLSADILDSAFKSAVNNDGIIEASQLAGGEVLLRSNQNIELNGEIRASRAIDAYAEENIILGMSIDDLILSTYEWEYISKDSRSYKFKEFGYYYNGGDPKVVLSRGYDIGKDSGSPMSGAGVEELPGYPLGLYITMDPNSGDWHTLYEDPSLNPDGLDHIKLAGAANTEYWWEDIIGLGDKDYDDVIIDFREAFTTVKAPGAVLNAPDIFLTAQNGSITQASGDIVADNLMLSTNTGISGPGANGGIMTEVKNVSAINRSSGDILIENKGSLVIADLSSVKGLKAGVTGFNGITNNAVGGEVNIEVKGKGANLNVAAPVDSFGPVTFKAEGNIAHGVSGDVTIHNPDTAPSMAINLSSPSHVTNFEYVNSTDRTVDVIWELLVGTPGYGFSGEAGGSYNMAKGSEIKTQGGNASLKAGGDVTLSLIDTGKGSVSVTSLTGSIIDGDKGVAPNDYDVIAHNIKLSAANGSVGGSGVGEEIDLGNPYDFSHLWDSANASTPDTSRDAYNETFNPSTGDWSFSTVSEVLADGSWWFHVRTLDNSGTQVAASGPAHVGPFIFKSDVPPPPPPEGDTFWQALQETRVYYEILDPSQFLAYEPAQPLGLYAYHPLTPTDLAAFDDIKLDAGAYDFISDNIEMKKKKANPYFGL